MIPVHSLSTQQASFKREQALQTSQETVTNTPYIIAVASAPRSGGTWLFNALRLSLIHAEKQIHSAWIDDYAPDDPTPFHVVKLHVPDHLTFKPNVTFSTERNLADRIASFSRMGWMEDTPEEIKRITYLMTKQDEFWKERTNYFLKYDDIVQNPKQLVMELLNILKLSLSEDTVDDIVHTLKTMKAPDDMEGRYDKATLMHPDHCSDGSYNASRKEEIEAILNSEDQSTGDL